jgi:uncharacterized protein (TIGR02246 family)
MLLLAVALGAVTAKPASAIIQETQLTEAIRDLVEQFVEAWNDDDVEALSALFTEDGTLHAPGGSRATSRHNIRRLLLTKHDKIFHGTTIRETITSVDFRIDGQAIVRGDYILNGLKLLGFIPIAPHGSFTLHVIENDEAWKIWRAKITR